MHLIRICTLFLLIKDCLFFLYIRLDPNRLTNVLRDVKKESPKVSLMMQSSNILQSSSMVVVCMSTGHPNPVIRWQVNKTSILDLKNSINKVMNLPRIFSKRNQQSSSLIFTKLLLTDTNTILTCEADNVAGIDVRHQKLTVLPQNSDLPEGFPNFQNNFFPLIKPSNSNVTIVCQAQGNPLPMVQWFKNYEWITETNRVKIYNDGSLFLSHISREDKGVYHCQAQNIHGLRLSDPSVLEITNYPVTPNSLHIVKLGADFVDISWRSGLTEFSDSENFILHYKEIPDSSVGQVASGKFVYISVTDKKFEQQYVLKNLFPYTNYNLWIESENEFGVSSPTSIVRFKTLPTGPQDVPRSITATSISNTAILVAWKPPIRTYGKFKSYQVIYTNNEAYLPQHWRQFSTKEVSVLLSHLNALELYHIRVKIVNDVGHGPLSKTISIFTRAGTPSQCPDFRITEIYQAHIKLEWGSPDPTKLFKEIQFNLKCIKNSTSKTNKSETVTSFSSIINTNLSMDIMTYVLPLKNTPYIKCLLTAFNEDGSGRPTEVEASTINTENSVQNFLHIVQIGSSFIFIKWKPTMKTSFDFALWVYRISSFDMPYKSSDNPQLKLNLSNSIPGDNGWMNYNFTKAFSSTQYVLGFRYLFKDMENILREYVIRSNSITTLKSDPSLVTNLVVKPGCSQTRPCLQVQWRNSQQFGNNDSVKYQLKYRITSPKSFETKYFEHILNENEFRLETNDKPAYGVTYEFMVSKFFKGKYGKYTKAFFTLQEAAPSDSPKNLKSTVIDSKTIRVTWKPPNPIYRNGEIICYHLRYFVIDHEGTTERFINVTGTNATLKDLYDINGYIIYVSASTKAGAGTWSDPLYFYPHIVQDLPVPINVMALRTSESELEVSWKLPAFSQKNKAPSTVAGFIILYSPVGKNPVWLKNSPQISDLKSKIKGLDNQLKYQVKVAAVDYFGVTGNFSVTVEEMQSTIPKMNLKTVRNLTCAVQSSKTLKVEWYSPSITLDIVKFEIIYSGSLNYISTMGLKKSEYIDKKTVSLDFEANVEVHNIKLEDLHSNAIYKIAVRPIYTNEESYQSHLETTCTTFPSVPEYVEPPVAIGLTKLMHQVIIKLYRCTEKNGEISNYSIIVGAFQKDDDNKITLLKEPDSYTFMELSVNTKSSKYTGVYIAISDGVNNIFRTGGQNFAEIILGDEREEYDLKLLSMNKKLERKYYYKCFSRVCLQGPTNSICKSSNWSVPFMIEKMALETNVSSSNNVDQKKMINKDDPPVLNHPAMVIIFPVCGAILATALIVIGCIIKRRKSKERFMSIDTHDDIRSSIMMKSSLLNGVASVDKIFVTPEHEESRNKTQKYTPAKLKPIIRSAPDLVTADSVLMCQDGSKLSPVLHNDSKKMRINTQKLENNVERPPILICNLYQYITDLKANDCTLLQSEFETLNTNLDDRFSWQRSNVDSNKSKNRYANVVAYDHTSVLLTPIDDVMGSDYINANYIDGYQKQNAYIATQGPLPDTTDDFWRMVWEQRSSCIVMMTRLEERSGIKCHQYWPNRGFICYGQMIVSHIDTFYLAYYTIRIFEVRHSKYSEKREIQHFQFTAWPDHGVPKLSTPLLMFIRRVRSVGKVDSGPKIVHCSAGVGRTGAFIVVDAQLERIKQEKTIDVFNYVSKIRCQRNYMVQTQAQYQFILETLLEAVEDGNTEVLACNFHAHVTKLSQIGISGTNQLSGFEMEFSKLNSLASNRGRHGVMLADFVKAAGNQPVNLTKNRVRNIIPYDWNRVILTAIRGIEGSDYINASYIDGYRNRKAYIAAQSPIPSTVEDFWRMIWDQHCGVVIVLNQPHEDKSHVYWPVNKSIRYQFFVVDPVVEYNMPNYILREFKVTDARDGEFRALRQFQYTQWPAHGCPKESESFLDFIRQVHKTKEQFGHMEPMVVHCSTGSGKTGVFIGLSIVLDRLQQESVVDMYQTIKLLHKQRIGLVQTEEQYEFCYMAVLDYLSNYEKMVEKSDIY